MQRGMEGQDEAECQEETAVETDDRVEQGNTGTVWPIIINMIN